MFIEALVDYDAASPIKYNLQASKGLNMDLQLTLTTHFTIEVS